MAKKISKILASERDYKVRPFALVDHEHRFYPPTVADLTERDAITGVQRYDGSMVYVEADETTYQLRGGSANADWTVLVDNLGATSHTGLADIGVYTHVAIDTHIDDATLHFTEASISITESQISDLGAYALASHDHDATYLAIAAASVSTNALESATTTIDVSAAAAPVAGQVLTAVSSTVATWQNPAAAAAGDIIQTGSPTNTYIGYFTADKNLSGDAGFTWITASALLTVTGATPEFRIQDNNNVAATMIAELSFWDTTAVVGRVRMDGTGDLRIENTAGDIIIDTGTADTVFSGNGNLLVGLDLSVTGYIDGYGGTPADGSVLMWVTANTRAEFTLGVVMATGTPVDNQVAVFNAPAAIEGNALFTWDGADLTVGTMFWDESAAQLSLGDGTLGTPGLEIDGSATANPYVNLAQGGVVRGIFRFADTADRVEISSSADDITLRPGNVDTVIVTQALLTAGTYEFDINQVVGAGTDSFALIFDQTTGEISLEDMETNHTHTLDAGSNVTITAIAANELLQWNGTAWINQTIVEIGLSEIGHTHLLAAGATDVTATVAEVNLLDLAGLTVGWVLSADTATTASWKAAVDTGILAVVDDTAPQLGGMLDVNGQAIGDGTLELLTFTEIASAVNQINITNAITATGPIIGASGGDTDIDLNLAAKGTGNISLGSFTLDADQAVGAGQDNYVLTYDDASGLIQLEVVPGGGVSELVNLSDVNSSTPTNRFVLVADGVDFESRLLVEADISDLGTYSVTSHTHLLAAGATDVTATAAEVNLLDLSGLTAGWVLSADTATTASWKAPSGGGASELVDLSDVVSATNTNRFVLVANGTTGYVGRALLEADISDLQAYILDITGEPLSTLSDVTITAIASGEILKWNGSAWINNTLAEAGISATGHTHLLAAGATDVTATAAEVNLLDLAGLTAGWVLSADTATTASWKAPTGGGDVTKVGTPVDNEIGVWTGDGTLEGDSNFTWTGAILSAAGSITLTAAQPWLDMVESDAGVDQGYWRLISNGEAFKADIFSDDKVNSYRWMSVERSGTGASVQVDTIDFTAVTDVTINSPLIVTGDSITIPGETTTQKFINIGDANGSTATMYMKIGGGRTGDGFSQLDLIGDATYTNYGLRMSRWNLGANSDSKILHAGTGKLIISAQQAGSIELHTTAAVALAIDASGDSVFSGTVTGEYFTPTTAISASGMGLSATSGLNFRGTGSVSDMTAYNTSGVAVWQIPTGTTEFLLAGKLRTDASTAGASGLNIPEGVAPTAPDDGDVWVTAAGEFFARLNGVSVDLSVSGGGIGGSITDNQIAVGATTADDIEGSANLTYDGTALYINSGRLDINGTLPQIRIEESDAAADEKNWMLLANGSELIGHLYNDAYSIEDLWIKVARTGRVLDSIKLYSNGDVEAFILANGTATFAGTVITPAATTSLPSLNIPEGVAPTAPVDGDHWLTVAGEYFVRLNGVSVDLAAAGTGIGGSITDNQIAVGATTADDIEGAATFTWDATTLLIDSDAATTLRVEAGASSDARILFYQTFNQRGIVAFDTSESAMVVTCTGGDVKIRPSNTDIAVFSSADGMDLVNGGIRMFERSDHAYTPAATFGEIWVKIATPNELYFTDDAGTDWLLNSAGGGDVTKVGTPVDNQVGVWTGDGTIEGTTGLLFTQATQPILRLVGTNGPQFDMNGSQPQFRMEESDGTLDQKNWMQIVSAEAFYGQVYSDSYANSYIWFQVERSGTGASVQVDTIDFTAATDVTVNSDLVITGSAAFATNGTVKLAVTNDRLDLVGGQGFSTGNSIELNGTTRAGASYRTLFRRGTQTIMGYAGTSALTGNVPCLAGELVFAASATGTGTLYETLRLTTDWHVTTKWGGFHSVIKDGASQVGGFFVDKTGTTLQGTTGMYATHPAGDIIFAKEGTIVAEFGGADADFKLPVLTPASATGAAGLHIAEGVAPTVPNDGDLWVTAAGEFFARLNGVSVDVSAAPAVDSTFEDQFLLMGA